MNNRFNFELRFCKYVYFVINEIDNKFDLCFLQKNTKKSKKLTEKDDTLETPKKEKNDSTENLPEVELQYNSKAGVIYIGQIPHGFYEDEMEGFFSQFGKIRRVRLVRSKKVLIIMFLL